MRPSPCRRVASASRRTERELLRIHQQPVAEEHRAAGGLGARAHAVEAFESCRCHDGEVRRPAQDGLRQRMVRPLLDGGGGGQHHVLGDSVRRHDLHDLRLADGERAGLVEDDDVELGRVFERRGVLEQDAVHRAEAGTHHDRHRRRQSQAHPGRRSRRP